MTDILLTTEGLFSGRSKPDHVGKVRETYQASDPQDDLQLLIITTDRISAFDVVLPTGIPDKGRVLNGLSVFWFEKLASICQNHFLTADVGEYPEPFRGYPEILTGRSMLVQGVEILPLECVVRGYLAGSGWKEYKQSGTVCGITLPAGLTESAKLPEPIFTPSTKAAIGTHDENLSEGQAIAHLARSFRSDPDEVSDLYGAMVEKSIQLYKTAAEYALGRGIIIADTKFEFGLYEGELYGADEFLTPDSSRFWDAATYEPGRSQDSFDKQFVRDWLESAGWNKQPPAPELPDGIIVKTQTKYREAYERLTEKSIL